MHDRDIRCSQQSNNSKDYLLGQLQNFTPLPTRRLIPFQRLIKQLYTKVSVIYLQGVSPISKA